ncbi:tetratricopeptide repeat protein [Archangium lansingense]|uniref:B box-type domain-containing protein n=1 Tax=Archangium lansingense TaxID=2995310 RepID=A0ABT3ZYR5_9BACT|nr:hypothetical protein [Archangium lansinium]MCY1074533.1 hypothetical protein [Archangium lansinium]
MSDSALPHCQFHPSAAAGWFCPACKANLCPGCTVLELQESSNTELLSCGRCGGAAEVLKVHRSQAPFGKRLLGAWLYPLRPSGLFALVAVGAVVAFSRWVFQYAPLLPGLVALAAWLGSFWGSLFWIVRSTSMGAQHFTAPDFQSIHDDLVDPAIRGVVATALIWVPGALFLWHFDETHRPLPLFGLMVLVTLLYAPMALLFAATGESKLSLLNPIKVVGISVKLGRPYLMVVAWMVPLALVHALVMMVAAWVSSLPIPLMAPLVAEAISLFAPFVMARLIGLLLYAYGDRVGYGVDSEFYEPALPGVKPRGKKRAAKVPAPQQRETHRPELQRFTEIEPASAPAAQPAPRQRFIELEPEPAPVAAPEPLEARLVRAVEANALDEALALYRQLPERLPPLPAACHLAMGQKAATVGDYTLAVRALKQVAQHSPEDPLAPKSCVILARLYGERLGDAASAQKLYRHVVGRYPGTDAARFAQSRLPPA